MVGEPADVREPRDEGVALIKAQIQVTYAATKRTPGFGLDVEVDAGPGITVLFGPSGSGKTLTLDSMAGFIAPDRGRVQVNGTVVFDRVEKIDLAVEKRRLGYLPQDAALFPHMTLRENVRFGEPEATEARVSEWLGRLGLQELGGRYPEEMSGGQQQRGAIARALFRQPEALLLDEPARGLDIALRREFHELLREMREQFKIPMVMVTHDLEEALAVGDAMLVYENGRIVARGRPEEVVAAPRTVQMARLFGLHHILPVTVVKRQRLFAEVGDYRVALPDTLSAAPGKYTLGYVPREAVIRPAQFGTGIPLRGCVPLPVGLRVELQGGWAADVLELQGGDRYELDLSRARVILFE